MSEENVEVVRRGYAAFAEKGVEGAIPFFTEDAVIYSIPEETKGSAMPEWPVHHWPLAFATLLHSQELTDETRSYTVGAPRAAVVASHRRPPRPPVSTRLAESAPPQELTPVERFQARPSPLRQLSSCFRCQ